MNQQDFCLIRLIANSDICGAVIGKSGGIIKQIRSRSGARIFIDTSQPNIPKSTIQISGTRNCVLHAVNLYLDRLIQIHAENLQMAGNKRDRHIDKRIEINFLFTYHQASFIIGVHGTNFKRIRAETNVFMRIEKDHLPRSTEKLAIVMGLPEKVKKAVDLIMSFYMEAYNQEDIDKTVFYEPCLADFQQPEFYAGDSWQPRGYSGPRGQFNSMEPNRRGDRSYRGDANPKRPQRRQRSPSFDRSLAQPRRRRRVEQDFFEEDEQAGMIPYNTLEPVVVTYPLNKGLMGAVIGRGGMHISRIREETGVTIKVQKENVEDRRVEVTLSGCRANVRKALLRIEKQIHGK